MRHQRIPAKPLVDLWPHSFEAGLPVEITLDDAVHLGAGRVEPVKTARWTHQRSPGLPHPPVPDERQSHLADRGGTPVRGLKVDGDEIEGHRITSWHLGRLFDCPITGRLRQVALTQQMAGW